MPDAPPVTYANPSVMMVHLKAQRMLWCVSRPAFSRARKRYYSLADISILIDSPCKMREEPKLPRIAKGCSLVNCEGVLVTTLRQSQRWTQTRRGGVPELPYSSFPMSSCGESHCQAILVTWHDLFDDRRVSDKSPGFSVSTKK